MRHNWKRYSVLFLMSAAVSVILCYVFVETGLYSFPIRLLPSLSPMPITTIIAVFSFFVLLGVRFSPAMWAWKIPFYWVMVHVGMLGETLALHKTELIHYVKFWDVWDSYTWWWIYLLVFEWVGGMVIPAESRKSMHHEWLQYGRLGWFLLHFILILTIFLGGFYLGRVSK
ncbi:CBO0543 family protein [Paenibacillus ferrarius]|nr:CBO0543 family protein [Paenibacillus ferrarius]